MELRRVQSAGRVAAMVLGALTAGLWQQAASAMSYRLVQSDLPNCKGPCPQIVVASGTIQQNEVTLFAEFVSAQKRKGQPIAGMVLIDSPGGFTSGAAGLGTVIRKLNMAVLVARPVADVVTRDRGLTAATCASACVIVLAGGAKRYYVRGSRVGVHQSHTGPTVLDPVTRQQVNGKVDHDNVRQAYLSYFGKMGISQELADVISRTSSEGMHWLSAEEMSKYRLAQDASSRP